MPSDTILFLSFSGPYPATDGKRQRTLALLKSLQESYSVDFLILHGATPSARTPDEPVSSCVRFMYFEPMPVSGMARFRRAAGFRYVVNESVRSHIAKLHASRSYRFVISRYIDPVCHVPDDLPVVCDIDDDFRDLHRSQMESEQSLLGRLRLWRQFALNIRAYRRLVSRLHLPIFSKQEAHATGGLVLPNLPFQLLLQPPRGFRVSVRPSFLFVGKLTYGPNAHGLKWLLTEVWPRINSLMTAASLTVVSNVAPADDTLLSLISSSRNVSLRIDVPDLHGVYEEHAAVLAPVFSGGGSSIKVIESLFTGRPVITTTFGARGFEAAVRAGLIMTHEEPDAFAMQALSCIRQTDHLPGLQRAAYEWASTHLSLREWTQRLLASLKAI